MKFSQRMDKLPPYLFVGINRKIAEKQAKGEDIISFGIGDPDLPTPPHIVERLCDAARDPANHRYPESDGLPELRRAIAEWYRRRFAVSLDPDREVVPLIGSKEGIGHIAFCLIDPGDIALVPDPGYPVYSIGTMLAGGQPFLMPLREDNGFLPDLDAVPSRITGKAKVMWLNYPNNPTGAVAPQEFFEKAVGFAKKHGLAVCHDAPYSEVAYDGYQPPSFMQILGAKEIGIEFHSLSKTYNMTGWRIGMAVGNRELINALFRIKSNLDSGVFQAVQYAAISGLLGPQDHIAKRNALFQQRRDKLVAVLNRIGLRAQLPKAGFYVWAKIPNGYTSMELADELLDRLAVVVTPGIGYGPSGEGYVRFSLTIADDRLDQGIARLAGWQPAKG